MEVEDWEKVNEEKVVRNALPKLEAYMPEPYLYTQVCISVCRWRKKEKKASSVADRGRPDDNRGRRRGLSIGKISHL